MLYFIALPIFFQNIKRRCKKTQNPETEMINETRNTAKREELNTADCLLFKRQGGWWGGF